MNILAGRGAVSMQNIADELGVSKVTVSKAINGKEGVSGPLRQKILQTAADHGYVLPDYGQRKARTIAIIMSERFHSGDSGRFYMGMYEHINRELRMRAYSSVMITPNPETLEHDAETIEKPGMFDGLIFLGILDKEVRERIDRIPLPKVYVDLYDVGYRSDSVVTESIYSAYEITKHLIRSGHREIGFVGTLGVTTSINDRYLGYMRALMEKGLKEQERWRIPDRDQAGRAVDLQLPQELPEAFMCNCDETAFRLVRELKRRGLSVPEDVSVVGFDDDIYAGLCEPQLTTVAVDMKEIGRTAVKCMVRRMERTGTENSEGEVCRIPGKLIFRDSVRERKGRMKSEK
ncbi:MAG: LacI family DNA-binding transcriptional regulator [Marvinbryantia sp.]|uniref:LacI family DNA-binding transcriptional regulator n=1 Tax=Marvinbryantia sp. TaxID=2496532 RepID=UPI00399ACEDF